MNDDPVARHRFQRRENLIVAIFTKGIAKKTADIVLGWVKPDFACKPLLAMGVGNWRKSRPEFCPSGPLFYRNFLMPVVA